jgi:hypothetical protein
MRPERCPALDPYLGAGLLNYLSRPNVRQHGIRIQGEAIVQGEHTLYIIAEADDEQQLREFMRPFLQAGSIDVYPASTCARVVASGGCAAPAAGKRSRTGVDPAEACQDAIDAGLVVHRAHPLNCETSLPALVGGVVMPNARFYVRNHFQIPALDPATFQLAVGGLAERPLRLEPRRSPSASVEEPRRHTRVRRERTDEVRPADRGREVEHGRGEHCRVDRCAAGRDSRSCGVKANAREVLFRGADGGIVDGRSERILFERSLPLDAARESGSAARIRDERRTAADCTMARRCASSCPAGMPSRP